MTDFQFPEGMPKLRGTPIFSTVHGSRLYGFHTESSDTDLFVVTDSTSPKALQQIKNGVDLTQIGWEAFLRYAEGGSHQSLEAMFSRRKVWHSHAGRAEYLDGMRVTGTEVEAKYRRTIRKFSFGDFKQRRHAVRLSGNLLELREFGRFNPELNFREAGMAGFLAESMAGNFLSALLLGGSAR